VQLVRTSDLNLTAVAHTVGYRNETTLSTLIRRRRGTTPAQLRRRDTLTLAPPRP
jgi:transcriptional regulator GlxA family with amidase domain